VVVSQCKDSTHPGAGPPASGDSGRSAAGEIPAGVVWHDLECGGYRADLSLWQELAANHDDPILDVGAGTGRVTLELARAGHRLTALDLDGELLGALRERAAGLQVETVCADACSFALDGREFGLCLVPMQTLQLLNGPTERIAFLRRARTHLCPGGLVACAIVVAVDPFDCAKGDPGPSPEIAWIGGARYTSRATRVSVRDRTVVIERERRIAAPGGEPKIERNVVELDRVSVSDLEGEAMAAELHPVPTREIHPTSEHVGSAVVMARA
jgi:SAM-dependent methyltransferase